MVAAGGGPRRDGPSAAALLRWPADPLAPAALPADLVAGSGGDWPDELTTWFGLHDGVEPYRRADFLDGRMLLSAQEARDHWAGQLEAATSWDDEDRDAATGLRAGEDTSVFDPRLVPITWDGATGHHVVDLRPGPMRGSVVFFDPEIGTTYVDGDADASIAALLQRCRHALENPEGFDLHVVVELASRDGDDHGLGVDDWSEIDGPPRHVLTPTPGWSWAIVAWTIAEFGFFHDPRTLAVLGPSFDYLLSLDADALADATALEPEEIGHVAVNCLLAACVDHACAQRGIEPPAWTSGTYRTMSEAYDVTDVPSAELRRLRAAPEAFRAHGMGLVWTDR